MQILMAFIMIASIFAGKLCCDESISPRGVAANHSNLVVKYIDSETSAFPVDAEAHHCDIHCVHSQYVKTPSLITLLLVSKEIQESIYFFSYISPHLDSIERPPVYI